MGQEGGVGSTRLASGTLARSIVEYMFERCYVARMAEEILDTDQAAQLAETFHLLGDPNRLRLVCACLDEAVSVQDLSQQLGLSPSLASHHLRLLRAARLMRTERQGKRVFYRAADQHVRGMLLDMIEHMQEPGE